MHSPLGHIRDIFVKTRPIHLTFFLTRRCNLACPFCFYRGGEKKWDSDAGELSLAEIERISRSLGKLLWLAFSGGEIFLRDDLVEISTTFYRNNRPSIMLFPTNGLLPDVIRDKTEQILRTCTKSTVVVKLSLDGLAETHDRLRRKKGSFDQVMETYRMLGSLLDRYPHFELGINTLFCSANQDEMDAIIEFVCTLGHVKTHTISLIRGDVPDKSLTSVDYDKYHAAVIRLEENLTSGIAKTYRFRGARIKAAQDIMQRRLIHRTTIEERRLVPCYAGRLNLVLTENGDVYPCEILSETFGNIRDFDYDMGRVIRSDRAKKIIRSIMDDQCYCTHECYFMTNILFNPRMYPSLVKEYLRLRS